MNPATFLDPRMPPAESFAQNQRGRELELKFLHDWRSFIDLPPWFVRLREANPKEDVYGHIDAFIETPWGEIPIQIKGSKTGKREFLKLYGAKEPKIAVVVIKPYYDRYQVKHETYLAIRHHPVFAPWHNASVKYAMRQAQKSANSSRFCR